VRLAIVAADADRADAFVDALLRAIGDLAEMRVVPPAEYQHLDDDRFVTLLDDLEAHGGMAVLPIDVTRPDEAARALRQCDRVLVVAPASGPPTLGAAAGALAALERTGAHPTEELVLLHPRGTELPSGTARRLALRPFRAHHHVRDDDAAAVTRVARHLTGNAIGLVLGGGGARGFAHIGAYRALMEARTPIDKVGGSSIGGVMATLIALRLGPDDILDLVRREFGRTLPQYRITLPVVSVLAGGPITRMFERMYGDATMEDLWLPSFVTTVNLTSLQLVGCDRGPVAQWVRASASPPGMFPPAVDEQGELVVDGGILDNVPCDLMARGGAGRIVAVSLSSPPYFGVAPGLRHLTLSTYAQSLRRRRRRGEFPTLARVLHRTAMLTSLQSLPQSRALADVFVAPDLDAYGFTEYRAGAAMTQAGYEAMTKAVSDHPEMRTWA
jgi:predicted acylesterase/phospholipase RssA